MRQCAAARLAATAALLVVSPLGGCVMPHCAAAARVAGTLLVISTSGGCMSCGGVLQPASPPATLLVVSPSGSCKSCGSVLLPAAPPPHCSSYHRRVAATVTAGATGLCLHNLIGEKKRKKEIHDLPLTEPSLLVLAHQVASLLVPMAQIRGPENRICKLKRISIWTHHETKGGWVEVLSLHHRWQHDGDNTTGNCAMGGSAMATT